MKKIITLIMLNCGFIAANAQNGKINGSVALENAKNKLFATVTLCKAKDSSLVKASVTEGNGSYTFENVKTDKYIIMASMVGYGKKYSNVITISEANAIANVASIMLAPVSKTEKDVTVTAKKLFVEQKADKMVVNVDAMISNAGSTALEVLEKAPGVIVDKDGNISLKGKQGVMIMVDGKQTFLSGSELTNMLRNMNSNQLDQIEIMTNPSAKYDAAGRSGIINIKTKKNKQIGFNGSAATSYTQGKYARTSNSLNMNYKNGKVNLFSTLSGNVRNNFQELIISRRYTHLDKTTKAIFEQNSYQKRERQNYNTKIGADFYATPKTTFGVVLTGNLNLDMDKGFNTSYLKNNTSILDSIVTAKSVEDKNFKNGSVNFNFRTTLDSTGKELTGDVDLLNYKINNSQDFINTIYNAGGFYKSNDNLVGELPTNIKIISAKMDYSQPIKKIAKLEAGVKVSNVKTENIAGYFNVVNNIKTPDYDKTNQYNYNENINAAYLNFNKEMKKWSVQTGLRLENTNYEGLQFGNPTLKDSSFKRSYTSLFPTVYVGFTPTEKNQFNASFGRRINRPDYQDLNPFLFFLDKYTYGSGNPFLRPMYSNVYEISHTYKQFLTTTLNYSKTKDLFTEMFKQQDLAIVVSQGNYGLSNDFSLSSNAQIPVNKWWNMNVYNEVKYNQFKGLVNGTNLDVEAVTYTGNLNNQFKFNKDWSGELSGFYRSGGIEGQIKIRALYQLNIAAQKQIWKKKATLKFSINDVLRSRNPVGDINFNNTEAHFRQFQDNRVATVSFNYRFGKPIKGLQKRKTGGAGDEQNRVKGSN